MKWSAVFFTGILLLSGCGRLVEGATERATEEILEEAADGDVEIDINSGDGSITVEGADGTTEINGDGDGSIKVESDEGTLEIGSGSDVGDDFPDMIPLPDGETVQTTTFTENDKTTQSVTMQVDGDAKTLLDDLASHIPEDKVVSNSAITSDGFFGTVTFEDWDGYDGAVTVIGENERQNLVSINYTTATG